LLVFVHFQGNDIVVQFGAAVMGLDVAVVTAAETNTTGCTVL